MEAVVKVSKEQWFKVVCWVSVLLKVAELWEAVWHEHGQQCRHDTHGEHETRQHCCTASGHRSWLKQYTSARFLNIEYKDMQTMISGRNSWFCMQLCKARFEYQEQLKTHFWDCILYEIFRLRWSLLKYQLYRDPSLVFYVKLVRYIGIRKFLRKINKSTTLSDMWSGGMRNIIFCYLYRFQDNSNHSANNRLWIEPVSL